MKTVDIDIDIRSADTAGFVRGVYVLLEWAFDLYASLDWMLKIKAFSGTVYD